jgi:L-serine deaminase
MLASRKLRDRTNGAAGVIPATLKYVTEFISQDREREWVIFCLELVGYTASRKSGG